MEFISQIFGCRPVDSFDVRCAGLVPYGTIMYSECGVSVQVIFLIAPAYSGSPYLIAEGMVIAFFGVT